MSYNLNFTESAKKKNMIN